EVRRKLSEAHSSLAEAVRKRFVYDWGCKTVLNVLKQAEALCLPERVLESGALFAKFLAGELASCKRVRDIRVHGLLIGIELGTGGWLGKWLNKKASWLYLASLLRHTSFPLFIGSCQSEPNVLKLTPPLSITPDEVRRVCTTLASVLRAPLHKLLPAAAGALMHSFPRRPN